MFLEGGEDEGIYCVKSASGQLGKNSFLLFNLLSPSRRSACVYHEHYSALNFSRKKNSRKETR